MRVTCDPHARLDAVPDMERHRTSLGLTSPNIPRWNSPLCSYLCRYGIDSVNSNGTGDRRLAGRDHFELLWAVVLTLMRSPIT